MNVILDANVLCEDFHFSGKNFRVFLGEASRIPASIFLPQVALDETINKYRERLETDAKEATKIAHRVSLLLKQERTPSLIESSVPDLVQVYKSHLQAALAECGVTVLPYPQVSHEKVVERDLSRMRPFRTGGVGYRDTLIWETLISFCHGHQAATIVFVTRNKVDFGPGPDLLGDMGVELKNKLIDPSRVRICPGLDEFNRTFIMPRLESLPILKEQLAAHCLDQFDVYNWLVQGVSTILESEDLAAVCVGFDPYYGSVYLSSVDRIREINVLDARRLTSGELLVSASAVLELVIDVSADQGDWERSKEVRNFFGNRGFGHVSAWIPSTVKIRFSLFLAPEMGAVESAELDAIEGQCGYLEINSVPRQDA